MHRSIACITEPEFINLQPLDINPLMSSCEIKVLYVGENRNQSYITKEVATEMAKTLRGAPIVGWFKEEKGDFMDHGDQVIIDGEGVKFKSLTRPYGFVSPDAKVWFQMFTDTDDFGNDIQREYLMTTGFLWTKQYPECQLAVDEGRPHSMELDKDSLDGHWSLNLKNGLELFIVNDAIFSKLCILGEDVDPCFEGSSVTAPQVSSNFTLVDNTFKQTLYSMMQDLKFALEGGSQMNEEGIVVQEEIVSETVTEEFTASVDEALENSAISVDNIEQNDNSDIQENTEDVETSSEVEVPETETVEPAAEVGIEPTEPVISEAEYQLAALRTDYETLQANYTALENQIADLQRQNSELVAANTELTEFKNGIEDARKDDMINSFYMLSEEDKAEVIANKSNYTLEDIESKLSVLCVRKRVNFTNTQTNEEKPAVTFNLDNAAAGVPAWIAACEKTQKNRK